MSLQKKLKRQRQRRVYRVRNKFSRGQEGRPRVCVFRSLNHIYAQIIDDINHNTVVSFSSLVLKKPDGDKTAVAKMVGIELGKLAQSKSIEAITFDRGLNRYHGRVRALAEGLRESGLKF